MIDREKLRQVWHAGWEVWQDKLGRIVALGLEPLSGPKEHEVEVGHPVLSNGTSRVRPAVCGRVVSIMAPDERPPQNLVERKELLYGVVVSWEDGTTEEVNLFNLYFPTCSCDMCSWFSGYFSILKEEVVEKISEWLGHEIVKKKSRAK